MSPSPIATTVVHNLIFAEFVIPPFHATIPVHRSSPVIVDYTVLQLKQLLSLKIISQLFVWQAFLSFIVMPNTLNFPLSIISFEKKCGDTEVVPDRENDCGHTI
jgi:hypothetical protein